MHIVQSKRVGSKRTNWRMHDVPVRPRLAVPGDTCALRCASTTQRVQMRLLATTGSTLTSVTPVSGLRLPQRPAVATQTTTWTLLGQAVRQAWGMARAAASSDPLHWQILFLRPISVVVERLWWRGSATRAAKLAQFLLVYGAIGLMDSTRAVPLRTHRVPRSLCRGAASPALHALRLR